MHRGYRYFFSSFFLTATGSMIVPTRTTTIGTTTKTVPTANTSARSTKSIAPLLRRNRRSRRRIGIGVTAIPIAITAEASPSAEGARHEYIAPTARQHVVYESLQ